MHEKLENKNFSAQEMAKIGQLVSKIREVVEWDLGKYTSDLEGLEIVDRAKAAMKEFEAMFDLPKTRFWAEPEREEHRPRPVVSKTFSISDMQKLRADLNAIDEVVGWDIDPGDEEGLAMLRDARESSKELKGLL